MIYFDNAATTKPCAESVAAVNGALERFGNPSSLHKLGLEAELIVTDAREAIAEALGAKAEEIYFTSGATESSNTAIFGAFRAYGKRKSRIVITSVEHPATAAPALLLEELGCEVVRVSPRDDGRFYAEDIAAAVDDNTFLLSMMLINNETGYILPVQETFSLVKKKHPEALLHCDCVQGFMKIPFKVKKLGADMLSLSGHKIHAPKGIGALYLRKGVHIPSLLYGGGQERGFRSGTESVPLIAGFGAAVNKLAPTIKERLDYVGQLRDRLTQMCAEKGFSVNSLPDASPYVVSISVNGLRSEVLLHYLEKKDICVSSGSACSKGKKSSVLGEFGLDAVSDSTIRVSFCAENTANEIDTLVEQLENAENELCKVSK
ncbi:MAG: cysteine desulfurase [Ruminococcus sp.]|nr:cysteine desulfurase [Ruminococcus sp.]